MSQTRPELADHPDRLRWNERYRRDGYLPSFTPHPLAVLALSLPLPDGPMLDLACGASGSTLLAAAAGRPVTAVDASDVALTILADEASMQRLDSLITLVNADLGNWSPAPGGFALVLCTGFWDREVFRAAARAVAGDGLIGWEALTAAARRSRPQLPAEWCLAPGEPASLLPAGFDVLDQHDGSGDHAERRQLLARRREA